MNVTLILFISVGLAVCESLFWHLTCVILLLKWCGRRVPGALNTAWLLTKYLALVSILGQPVLMLMLNRKLTWLDWLGCVLGFVVWMCNKDVGDDDWKNKLKNKLKEKVEVFKGKLVVVPQPA